MKSTSWTLIAIVVAAAAGGGVVYVYNQSTTESPQPSNAAAITNTPAPQEPAKDKTEEKLKGIGSIRDLKPVELPK